MSSSIILYLEFFLAFGKNARNDVSINLGGYALESRKKCFERLFHKKNVKFECDAKSHCGKYFSN